MAGNPPPIKIPEIADKNLQNFLKQLKDAFYQLWYQSGAGTGIVPLAGGGTGSDTVLGAQTALSLVPGTNVQAYDAGLQSIAGLTTAADKLIYTTASDTYAVTAFTASARSLLDDTTTDAMLTTLGGTTIGINGFKLTNPSAVTFPRFNADNTVTALSDVNFRTAIGLSGMATQDPASVSFTGGAISGITINNCVIGGTTKAAGSFTTLLSSADVQVSKTITAAGTTGAQTIDKTAGSVNFAIGAASVVVTNSLATANSVILATVAANDATMKAVAVVQGSGSFTIYPNAVPTAETRVNFLVIN